MNDTTHLTTNQLCYLNIITTTDNFPFYTVDFCRYVSF